MTAQPKATTSTKKEDAAFKVKKQIAESGGSVHTEIQMLYNNKCKHGCSSDLSDNLILWYSILAPVNINH
ncbi:hypothetical protein AB838_07870 [Rhodobacteraceae bacterium (ex Bugula neritina AB1)]|nr:hypothetical protein AB838_07870 [Rhodobacteraceae bacterium (ex Bugula neritina AB1)]